jgi:hypothetical protein
LWDNCEKRISKLFNFQFNFQFIIIFYYPNLRYGHLYAADETGLWLDATGGMCVDERGAKEISVRTTGHDKLRVTVMLTGRADGYKCRPFVLLPRKRPDKDIVERFKNKLILSWSGTIWMNDEITEEYLTKIFGPGVFQKRLLVWDSFRSHISTKTKEVLKKCNLDVAVIPGGTTKFIQVF